MSMLPIRQRPTPTSHQRVVVLVDLPWTRDQDPRIPLGHASILASLRAAGIDARSVVLPVNSASTNECALFSAVLAAAADVQDADLVVGVGAYVWSEPLVQRLLPALRAARPRARLVVGGPQATFATTVQGLYPDADAVVRGAGESAMTHLAEDPDGTPRPGVTWRLGADAGSQARVDLDSLPSPFLDGTIDVRRGSFLRWETKRGCSFKCSFCQHRNPEARDFQRLSHGRILEEIALFSERGVADIAVLDPIFNDGDRALKVLRACASAGLTARLSLQARIELTDAAFLQAARGLDLRLEFGLQTIHPAEFRAVERPNNLRAVDEGLRRVRDAGIPFEVSLIYGLPHQTLSSFEESVAFCLDRGVPTIKAFPLMLLRGTKLELDRARWGLVEDDGVIPQVVASDSFDAHDHRRMEAVSGALRRTEGAHPSLPELWEIARLLPRQEERFSPSAPSREVAA